MVGTASRLEILAVAVALSSCSGGEAAPTASGTAAPSAVASVAPSAASRPSASAVPLLADGDARVEAQRLTDLDPKRPETVERLAAALRICIPLGENLPPELTHCKAATISEVAFRLGEACALQDLELRASAAMRVARAVDPERKLDAGADKRVQAAFEGRVGQGLGGGGTRRPTPIRAQSLVEGRTGSRPAAEIDAAMLAAQPSVVGCYASALSQHPLLEGSVRFTSRIANDGRVEVDAQRATLADDTTVACIARVTRAMKLPDSGGEAQATLGWQLANL